MFNDKYGLTKSVLEGNKVQTRRIVPFALLTEEHKPNSGFACYLIGKYAKYHIGEEVAIAQSYDDIYMEKNAPCPIPEKYRLNAYKKGFNQGHNGWKNKMYVSANDMPYRIKITNIHIERLQDISEEDCLKEGVKRKNLRYVVENQKGVVFYTNDPILAFRCLIDKTCGKGTWESNPYVFVYDFELFK